MQLPGRPGWMGGGGHGLYLGSSALPSVPTLTTPSPGLRQRQCRALISLVELGRCREPNLSFRILFDQHGSVIIYFSELVSALGIRIQCQ